MPRVPLLPVTLLKDSPTVGELSPGMLALQPATSGSAPDASMTAASDTILDTTASSIVVLSRLVTRGLLPLRVS